jgi:hypothetical protein
VHDRRARCGANRVDLEAELLDVALHALVRVEHLHRAGLGVEAVRERLAEGEDPAAGPGAGLEDGDVVSPRGELAGRGQAGHPGADDDDLLAGGRTARAGPVVR